MKQEKELLHMRTKCPRFSEHMAVYFSWTFPAYCNFKDTALVPFDNATAGQCKGGATQREPGQTSLHLPFGDTRSSRRAFVFSLAELRMTSSITRAFFWKNSFQ